MRPSGVKIKKSSTKINGKSIDLESLIDRSATLSDGTDMLSDGQGMEAVDLGLSVKWATCNLEASSPEQPGEFYAWGETRGKKTYSPSTYTFHFRDNIKTLPLNNDVAHQKLGGNWRMPTQKEFEELIENCTKVWTTYQGRQGMMFTSKINGKSIFLPAVGYVGSSSTYNRYEPEGYYWSSTPAEIGSNYVSGREMAYFVATWVFRLRFGKSNITYTKASAPENGMPVRPVCE